MLEDNKTKANDFFKKLKGVISNINFHTQSMDGNEYKIRFTYYDGMKTWSHKAMIIANQHEVFFESPRLSKVNGMEKYQFHEYNEREVDYKIPLTEKFLILKVLTEFDRFKMTSNF